MPHIFDNIDQPLLPALTQTLSISTHADFCVGYFNLRGWKALASYIEGWPGGDGNCCRVLVGMQRLPQDEFRQAMSLIRKMKKCAWCAAVILPVTEMMSVAPAVDQTISCRLADMDTAGLGCAYRRTNPRMNTRLTPLRVPERSRASSLNRHSVGFACVRRRFPIGGLRRAPV
jgi:hypothetical protein